MKAKSGDRGAWKIVERDMLYFKQASLSSSANY
jgi:hypothetical protein